MGKAFWRALPRDLICRVASQAVCWESGHLKDRGGGWEDNIKMDDRQMGGTGSGPFAVASYGIGAG